MVQMDIKILNKINLNNIKAAGPRYSPIIDPSAPNLEITPLINAVEALAVSDKYKAFIVDLEESVSKVWKESPKAVIALFSSISPIHLLRLLNSLKGQKPGNSEITLRLMDRITLKILKILQADNNRLWEKERLLKEHTDEWRTIQSALSDIRKLESAIGKVSKFTRSLDFKFISINRMLLLGEWGTGKTHLLCDVTKERMQRNLPTLFFLAHRLRELGAGARADRNPDLCRYHR